MNKKAKANDDLLARWELASANGISREQFAAQEKLSKKVLDNRLYRATKNRKKTEDKINQVDDIIDGNYRHLAANTNRIKTVDELLTACQVDLTEWQLDERYEVGSWEMGRRAEHKALKWENGRIEQGYAEDTGKIWIETLYRVRANLVRKQPRPVQPMIQPVWLKLRKVSQPKSTPIKSGKALIVPDSQTGYRRDFQTNELIPFHDRKAHDIILQIAASDDFDAVVYLGDGLDFAEWSDKFVSEPEFYYTTQPAIIEYAWFLGQMKTRLPNANHSFILGNHEARPDLMMRKHLQAACQLKPHTEIDLKEPYAIDRLLGLQELGISISDNYPNGEVWLGQHARCVHTDGLSSNPGGTAAKMITKLTETTLAGHNHRLETATKNIDDCHGLRFVTAATCGCLCHLDYRVPGHRKGQHWQQGFATVQYDAMSPDVKLYAIIDNQTAYQGRRFVGRDYAAEISGWEF